MPSDILGFFGGIPRQKEIEDILEKPPKELHKESLKNFQRNFQINQ